MLRIHVEKEFHTITLCVEGRIVGDGVAELERCCQEVLAQSNHCKLIIDLDEVMSIDGEGWALLQRMSRTGVDFHGKGLHSQDLIERLQKAG